MEQRFIITTMQKQPKQHLKTMDNKLKSIDFPITKSSSIMKMAKKRLSLISFMLV